MAVIILPASRFFGHGNSRALCKPAHRGRKIQMLVIHYESENRPTCPAAETMIGLALWIDVEGGRFLPVERAQRPPACSRAFQRKVRADDFDDIISFGDALDSFLRDAGHEYQITLRVNLARGRFNL